MMYYVVTRRQGESGVCPKCRARITQVSHWVGGNALEWDFPEGTRFMVMEETPFFRCPDHPEEWICAPCEHVNQKALFKRYITGEGRAEAQGTFKYVREREEMDCLSGLSRAEAERILTVLRDCGVQCRIMPWLIAKEGDTW